MSINKWLSVAVLVMWSTHIFAEPYGTAFTYQGQLQYQGSAAQGEFDFMFTLFDSELDGTGVATPAELENIEVTEGRFTVELDFGTAIQASDQYWLEIGVRPGSSAEAHALLEPRQYLYPSPRSVFALRSANSDTLQGHPAADFALSLHDHAGQYWLLGGNAGTIPGHFLGTVDNQALELRVNGGRALRLEPGTSSPNVLGGYVLNSVTGGAQGATISGGGRDLAINQVSQGYATIGGGAGNTASGYATTIGGGEGNQASGAYAAIGGGQSNTVAAAHATAGGGEGNQADGAYSTVAGGRLNAATAAYTSIGGGLSNTASGNFAGIGAGSANTAGGAHAAVGGGMNNDAQARFAAIAGGGPADEGNPSTTNNRVTDDYGFVGGGGGNTAGDGAGTADDATFATVSGGRQNSAAGIYSMVGGGDSNTASGYAAMVGGGMLNSASNQLVTVAGGSSNAASGLYSTIGGGKSNSSTQRSSTVGGGEGNQATGAFATVPGGALNTASGNYSLAAGQGATAAHTGSFVWSDSDTEPFSSTADDQFLISAAGGVGIGTDAPLGALHVIGDTTIKGNARVLGEDDLVFLGSTNQLAPDCLVDDPGSDDCLMKPISISVVGNTAFVVSSASNQLAAFDVTDPDDIHVIDMTNSSLSNPLSAMAAGSYVYVGSNTNNLLAIFELSGNPPNVLKSIGGVTLPGEPQAVFVSGAYAYLVGHEDPNPFFAVVDVSDPTNPVVRGSVPEGGTSVHVVGSRAYVVTPTGLAVYDVSDPDAVALTGSTSEMASSPSAIHVTGNRAYVTMKGSNSLVIYDVSNPAAPTALGSSSTGALVQPVSLVVSGQHAYVACGGDVGTGENNGVVVLDVSDPASIVVRGTTSEEGQKAGAIAVVGKRVFITSICTSDECHTVEGDRFAIYEFNHLQTPTLQAGNVQAGYLDVVSSASVANGLSVGGGLNVGQAHVGGDLGVGGELKVAGEAHVGGNLSLGGDFLIAKTGGASLFQIGREDDFFCDEWDVSFTCLSWRTAILGFTNDITVSDNKITGWTFDHCAEGRYLDAEECCGVLDPDGAHECLLDVTPVNLEGAVVMQGSLVPSCDAGQCAEPEEEFGGFDLGHPELRWNEVWAANGLIQTSDGRMKDNVTSLSYGMADLARLQPVLFAWKDGNPDARHLGLIAQEVHKVIPELVHGGDDPGDMLGINYAELVPVLINAVKELNSQVSDQALTIETLQERLIVLEKDRSGDE